MDGRQPSASWPPPELFLLEELFFVFGRETNGIPKKLIEGKEEYCLRIHMSDKVRSLNLSNTAAIVIYEVLRQQGFPNLS